MKKPVIGRCPVSRAKILSVLVVVLCCLILTMEQNVIKETVFCRSGFWISCSGWQIGWQEGSLGVVNYDLTNKYCPRPGCWGCAKITWGWSFTPKDILSGASPFHNLNR